MQYSKHGLKEHSNFISLLLESFLNMSSPLLKICNSTGRARQMFVENWNSRFNDKSLPK